MANEGDRIVFDTVEVTEVETGQVVHRGDIAARGLHIVSEAIEAAGGTVSIPEEGLKWKDQVEGQ